MKKGHSMLSKNEPACRYKEGCRVGLGQEEFVCVKVGGTV